MLHYKLIVTLCLNLDKDQFIHNDKNSISYPNNNRFTNYRKKIFTFFQTLTVAIDKKHVWFNLLPYTIANSTPVNVTPPVSILVGLLLRLPTVFYRMPPALHTFTVPGKYRGYSFIEYASYKDIDWFSRSEPHTFFLNGLGIGLEFQDLACQNQVLVLN